MSSKHTLEDFSDALTEFNKDDIPSDPIPEVLEDYIIRVAKTGETTYPWPRILKVFKAKLMKAIEEFKSDTEFNMDKLPPAPNVENVTFDAMRTRITSQIDSFQGAPFTIQRLCEMVTNPTSHYKRIDKFLRAIEKNVNVVTTVDPFGKKIVCDTKPLLNGTEGDPAPPNLPPTYSSAPWAPAAPAPAPAGLWAPHAPLLHTTTTTTANGIDNRTIENSSEKDAEPDQSEASESPSSSQSASSDSDHVTASSDVSDVGPSLPAAASETKPVDSASAPDTVAMVTESSSVEAASVQAPPVDQPASNTMDATETAPTLEASRPGKRESSDEQDAALVSPAKRVCLEKDAAEVTEATDAPESNGANHEVTSDDAKTDDVTSTAEVTNGDHVAAEEAEEVTGTGEEVVASEDSNDSEALTTSSEESGQPAPEQEAEAEPKPSDDVTEEDDVSKDGATAEAEADGDQ